MFLKKIEIMGFKSFADKVTIELDKGITAVIGPNGSGKSNISDAVRWVLGEQSIKSLRGSRIEDVIFAGTENRKPLGFAEATLTFDNSSGMLPIEFTEVTVTRRVYRSGESEFLINKNACRLKDINELFMGTGVGKDGYSIIGQGRIDEILSTKSEDRRLIFEEAAGIMKYKVRKVEAERKLEQTRQNLLRINDIIGELENQIGPLKEQSEAAKKYLALKENLKILEVNVFIDNMSKFKEKADEIQILMDQLSEQIESEQSHFEKKQDYKKQQQNELLIVESEIEELQNLIFQIGSNMEQTNSEVKIAGDRIANNVETNEKLSQEINEFKQRIVELESEKAGKGKRLEQLISDKERFTFELKERENELEMISQTLDSEQEHVEAIKADIIDKMGMISEKKTELNSLNILFESLIKRQSQIDEEVQQIVFDVDAEGIKKEDISESIKKSKEFIVNNNKEILNLEEQKKELNTVLKDLTKKMEEVKSEVSNKQSRYRFLNELEKEYEGYSKSVKGILEECTRNHSFRSGIHGALAQLITVPKEFETAIEMTLGAALQNIVTDNEESAKKAIDFLKQKHLGRATFLPISSVNGREINEQIEKIESCTGFIGVASKLLSYEKKYQGVVNNLLGRTIVVDNLDNAIAIAKKYKYAFKLATLEGDIINPSGSMSGGSNLTRTSGILSRGMEIKELNESIEESRKLLNETSIQVDSVQKKINEIEIRISRILEDVREYQMNIAREEEKLITIENFLDKLGEKSEILKAEKKQINMQLEEFDLSIKSKIELISSLEREVEEQQTKVQSLQEKFKQSYAQKDKVYGAITDIKISLSSIDESLIAVEEVAERITKEMDTCIKNIDRRQNEIVKNTKEDERLKELVEKYKQSIKESHTIRAENEVKMTNKKQLKEQINVDLNNTETEMLELIKKVELLKAECSRLEVKKSKVDLDMESLQNKMWDEYEVTLNNAKEYQKDIGSIQNAQREINRVRNNLKELGVVNVAAIDEYIKTKERYEFLINQRNDLELSEDKLRRVISEMTSIMKRQFLEQFNHISKNFDQVFRELFGGGRATLKLSDEENILESGIDIEVQPPGKKLQNMLLLSGGEKAFTAIALLFGILKINPSPFCILDEIEAALDEVNVYRFADYIKKFTFNTQFILVTHRKGTMESADTLYGVTMEERGVSKLVSVKMKEKAS